MIFLLIQKIFLASWGGRDHRKGNFNNLFFRVNGVIDVALPQRSEAYDESFLWSNQCRAFPPPFTCNLFHVLTHTHTLHAPFGAMNHTRLAKETNGRNENEEKTQPNLFR